MLDEPTDPLDPTEALQTIRTLARVSVEAEPETAEARAKLLAEHMRMILALCDRAMPRKARRKAE